MTTETILTRERVEEIAEAVYEKDRFSPTDEVWCNLFWLSSFAKAIEQAVLHSPEIQALRNQDPLQGAANWFVEAITNCDVTDIQYHLIIGYNRAKRLFDAAMEQQHD